jgi:hypothetical protein
MAGTPMLTVFHIDAKDQAIKDFGKHVAVIAKTQGGPRYLTYHPVSGDGPKDVVYIWFPDGPESAGNLQANKNAAESAALIDLANKAKGGYKAFGKARLHRIAESGRSANKAPPAYLAVLGVKVDKAKGQAMKGGLKLLHQAAVSKNPHVRYAAHKLGDGEHGVLLYGMDSHGTTKASAPGLTKDKAVDALMEKTLASTLPGAVKGSKQMILQYLPEYSNP